MSVESIVRPFQSGDVFTARTVIPVVPPSGVQFSTDDCTLTFGDANPAKFDDIPSDLVLNNFNVEWKEDKDHRVTETVRVTQEDNPDNFIEFQRLKSTAFKNQTTGQSMAMSFADWDDGRK